MPMHCALCGHRKYGTAPETPHRPVCATCILSDSATASTIYCVACDLQTQDKENENMTQKIPKNEQAESDLEATQARLHEFDIAAARVPCWALSSDEA